MSLTHPSGLVHRSPQQSCDVRWVVKPPELGQLETSFLTNTTLRLSTLYLR